MIKIFFSLFIFSASFVLQAQKVFSEFVSAENFKRVEYDKMQDLEIYQNNKYILLKMGRNFFNISYDAKGLEQLKHKLNKLISANVNKSLLFYLTESNPGGYISRLNSLMQMLTTFPEVTSGMFLDDGIECASACALLFLFVDEKLCHKNSKIHIHSIFQRYFWIIEKTDKKMMEAYYDIMLKRTESQNTTNSYNVKLWLEKNYSLGVFNRLKGKAFGCDELSIDNVAHAL
jgi:hypothetical protein